MNLSGLWDFTYTEKDPGLIDIPSHFDGKIPVPGCWDDFIEAFADYKLKINEEYKEIDFTNCAENLPDASLPFICGTVWYRKTLNILEQHQYAVLRLGRVTMDATIFLNGQLLDCHIGYSTNFEIIFPAIPQGDNELIIAVSNTRRNRIGCFVRGFKGYSGGVFGNIELRMYKYPAIKDLFIYPDTTLETLNWQSELYNTRDDLLLSAKIFKDGNLIDEIISENLNFQSDATKLIPWSDDTPELYQIELTLLHNGKVIDIFNRNFGMRRLTTDKMNLKLNGTPVFLRGNTEHAYFAESCTPPTEKAYYLKIVSRLKELGFNWLRVHTSVPPEEYMQSCDELGMLIQVEAPVGFGMREWIDIVKACRNHPSVTIYCAGNEELLDEEKLSYLECVANQTKLLAPDSLFNPQEGLRGIEYSWEFSDFSFPIKRKPFMHNRARLQHAQSFSDVFGQFPWGQLSYSSNCCDTKALNKKLEYYRRPCLSHELCIHGTYLDMSLECRYKNTRIGNRIYQNVRKNMIEANLIEYADLYYRNSCFWQQALRKHALENARSCSNIAGYDLLGAIDYHWHRYGYPCGIMNEFYELKPGETTDNVLSYNGRSVLLLDKDNKYCYQNNETLKIKVLFSCFEPETIKKSTLEVNLTNKQGKTLECKFLEVTEVKSGNVTELGSFEFLLKSPDSAEQYFINISFSGFKNKWPIWVFPETTHGESDIIETEHLDDILIERISKGASCILYGNGPFPAIDISWQTSTAGRAEGNLATVINKHPIFDNFPHDGWCDWQFAQMINDAKAIDLTALNLPIFPIVEMVSSFKKIKRQAMVFELKINAGYLIVCTFNLNNSPVAGNYLKAQLQDYAKNGKIEKNILPLVPAKLNEIINHKYSSRSILPTDIGFDALGQLKIK